MAIVDGKGDYKKGLPSIVFRSVLSIIAFLFAFFSLVLTLDIQRRGDFPKIAAGVGLPVSGTLLFAFCILLSAEVALGSLLVWRNYAGSLLIAAGSLPLQLLLRTKIYVEEPHGWGGMVGYLVFLWLVLTVFYLVFGPMRRRLSVTEASVTSNP